MPAHPAPPDTAYDYTAKGNFVAVISNGTAVLGLGDLGALAAKPVMEGKAALFKRFADIDSIDLEIDTRNVDEFVNCVRFLHPAFGGINLEDIRAPECFVIEERLRELLDIPVFHDDQHGTAIITAAGLINALHLTGRELGGIKMVVNGAGAASIACVELLKSMGLPNGNVVLCDTKGVVYRGRTDGMNQWKSAHAVETVGAHAGRGDRRRRRVLRPVGQGCGRPGDGPRDGASSRSSSRWPIPIRRSPPRRCAPCEPTRSSPPAVRITRTRSTMSSAFHTSSAARSMCAPRRSTTR